MDLYLQKLINYYNGNEVHAIKHVCQQFDVVFHVDAYKNAKVENQPITFSQYLSKRNLHQTTKVGNTYLDGMKTKFYEDGYDHVMSAEQAVMMIVYLFLVQLLRDGVLDLHRRIIKILTSIIIC